MVFSRPTLSKACLATASRTSVTGSVIFMKWYVTILTQICVNVYKWQVTFWLREYVMVLKRVRHIGKITAHAQGSRDASSKWQLHKTQSSVQIIKLQWKIIRGQNKSKISRVIWAPGIKKFMALKFVAGSDLVFLISFIHRVLKWANIFKGHLGLWS